MKFKFWLKTNTKEAETLNKAVTPAAINLAYKERIVEIESLRKYDRGEKTIIAPDLRNIVRSL